MTRSSSLPLAMLLACSGSAEVAPAESGSRPRRCVEPQITPQVASDAARRTVRWTTRLIGEDTKSTRGIVTVDWTYQTVNGSWHHVSACVETRDVPSNLYVRPLLHQLPHHGLDVELEIRASARKGTSHPQHSLRWSLEPAIAGATVHRDSGFEPEDWTNGLWNGSTRLQAQDSDVVLVERATDPR